MICWQTVNGLKNKLTSCTYLLFGMILPKNGTSCSVAPTSGIVPYMSKLDNYRMLKAY